MGCDGTLDNVPEAQSGVTAEVWRSRRYSRTLSTEAEGLRWHRHPGHGSSVVSFKADPQGQGLHWAFKF